MNKEILENPICPKCGEETSIHYRRSSGMDIEPIKNYEALIIR